MFSRSYANLHFSIYIYIYIVFIFTDDVFVMIIFSARQHMLSALYAYVVIMHAPFTPLLVSVGLWF